MAVVDEIIASDFVFHSFEDNVKGKKAFKQYVGAIRTAFPDIYFTTDDLITEGNKVVSHWTVNGTQKGEFMEIPASHQSIKLRGVSILFTAGGKITEVWPYWDRLSLMKQLGRPR